MLNLPWPHLAHPPTKPALLNWAFPRPTVSALIALPWVALSLLLALYLAFPEPLKTYGYVPMLLSVVLFGLPHGSLDHLVPVRQGWKLGRSWRGLALFLLAYLGVVLLYVGGWVAAPMLAFWAFLLASVLHWGHGDLDFLERALGRERSPRSVVTLLLRGSLPIVVPFLAFPDAYDRLARGAAKAFNVTLGAGPLWSSVLTQGLTMTFCIILGLSLADTLISAANRRAALIELAEIPLLLAVFLVVPAELSIGIYFTLWHAWRHLGRLLHLNSAPLNLAPVSAPGVKRLILDLTPITVIALLMLGGLYLYAAPRVQSAEDFAAMYLALVAAMTLPHALVVAAMDDTFARWVRLPGGQDA